MSNARMVLACDDCFERKVFSLIRCKHCNWHGCRHVVDPIDQKCTPETNNCREYAADRARRKHMEELRAAGVCVTLSGRTDLHFKYVRFKGKRMVCAFCGKGASRKSKSAGGGNG